MMKKLLCSIALVFISIGIIQAQAEIDVTGNSVSIVDGDTTPELADDTDFGQINIGSTVSRTYTVTNLGAANLFVSPPSITGTGFSVTANPDFLVVPSASTTFTIEYTATAGISTASISLQNSDSDENPYDFNIQAEGIVANEPDINVTGNSVTIADGDTTPDLTDDTDFGQVTNGTTSTRVYTIENTGNQDLFISIPPTLTGDSAFTIVSNPSFQVTPGNSTSFTVQFAPTSIGIVSASLSITSSDPDDENPYTFDIQGEGAPVNEPDILILGNGLAIADGDNTPSTADDTDFGQVATGSTLTRTFTIENEGAQTLFISIPPNITGSSSFSVTANPSFSVAPGSSTTFSIEFAPTAANGIEIATVSIISNDPDAENPYTFDIQGEGIVVTNPDINVQGNGIDIADGDTTPSVADDTDFGSTSVGSIVSRVFTIENTGNATLFLGPPSVSGGAFSVVTNPAFSVAPGGNTNFTIEFNPLSVGVEIATISIDSNDPDSENPYTFDIQGEGLVANEPEMDVLDNASAPLASGGSVNFGTLDVSTGSQTFTFTIENSGTADLNLTDPSPFVVITGDTDDFTLGLVPSGTVGVSDSTTFTITFNPTTTGARNASVSIANNDGDEDPYTFALTGQGEDTNAGTPLLITQYYENGANDVIEVKNISNSTVVQQFFLCVYEDLNTITGVIDSSIPNQSVVIPTLAPGQVITFSGLSFSGNDVILISENTEQFNCYNDRIDIVGVVGSTTPPVWGANTSLIKGCGTNESPSLFFGYDAVANQPTDYIRLTTSEVDAAPASSNLFLGTQTIGPTTYTSSWSNGLPDKTKNAIINGTYSGAIGSFSACDLVINASGSVDFSGSTSNFVKVQNDLTINGNFALGDNAALVTVSESASITGSITKEESTTTLNNSFDFTYWSSPVQNANIATVFSGVDPTRIFEWRTPVENDYGGWQNPTSSTMLRARGYISEAPNGVTQHNISFTGTPHNGIVPISLGFDISTPDNGGGFNLIGNPYPCAIDIDEFIFLNDGTPIDEDLSPTEVDGTIWLWTHNTAYQDNEGILGDYVVDDYATYNLTGGVAATGSGTPAGSGGAVPTNNIGSGQGFFVRAIRNPGNVFFTNAMKLDGQNTQFFRGNDKKKSNETKDRIWLDLTSKQGGAFNQILIGFFENATDGEDRGYDGIKFSGGNYVSLYSLIDNKRFAIQGLGSFSSEKTVSIGFDAWVKETFSININSLEGVLNNEEIYLVDNYFNVVHDLKASPYEFEVTETGSFSDRFTLQFNKSVLGVDDVILNNNFIVANEDNTLRVRASDAVANIKVYDMLGRLLIDTNPNVVDFTLNTDSIAKGTVLVLNATLENGAEISKKAIKF